MGEIQSNSQLTEKSNRSDRSLMISTIASDVLREFGLENDEFIYASFICWLRKSLKSDVVLPGGKYSIPVSTESLFEHIGTEVVINEIRTISIDLPTVKMVGIYYDSQGRFVEIVGNEEEIEQIYLSVGEKYQYISSLKDFEVLTAALYGEATNNLEEMQAIGDVIMNRAEYLKTSLVHEITSPRQVNGYNSASIHAILSGRVSNENEKLNNARCATISTLSGTSRGKSNGAYFWDGSDIAVNEHFTEWGIHYTESGHDIYGTGDSTGGPYQNYNRDASNKPTTLRGITNYILESTAAYGGTIFWKKSSEYMHIMQERAFSR